MNSRYISFILRMQLEIPGKEPHDGPRVRGSVHQVGQSQIRHFDSIAEILEIVRENVDRAIRSAVESDVSNKE